MQADGLSVAAEPTSLVADLPAEPAMQPPPAAIVPPPALSPAMPVSSLLPSAPAPAASPPATGVPPEPTVSQGVNDPHQMAPLVAQLSATSLRAGRVALGILSAVLRPEEVVIALVQGQYQNQPAVGALTSERLLLVNEHEWQPDVREVPLTPDLVVQGLQDERTASLTFITEGVGVTISAVAERPLAHDMARLVRERIA